MVQPTRMVGTSCALATETNALAASNVATTTRFIECPLCTLLIAHDDPEHGTTEAKEAQDLKER
jgi:hypothetical protein